MNEVMDTIKKLRMLRGDMGLYSDSTRLPAICRAIYGEAEGWSAYDCEELIARLVGMLELCDLECLDGRKLSERGLARLPVDANGEAIHIGDEMADAKGVVGRTHGRVIEISYGTYVTTVTLDTEGRFMERPPSLLVHYHEPTVEDVLDELEGMRGTGDYEAVVTRCAELAETLRGLLCEEADGR